MAAKRWPYFAELAAAFSDVVVVGTPDDLRQHDNVPMNFPPHVRSLVGQLSLRETAELMAAAGVVVGNDSGLSHIAAAVGTPTIMLFGPTPHESLGSMPDSGIPLQVPKPTRLPIFANSQKGNVRTGNCVDSLRSGPIVTSEDDPSCGAVAKAPSLQLAPNDSEVKRAARSSR